MFSSAIKKTQSTTPTKRSFTPTELKNYVDKVQSRLNSPMEKKSKAFAFARLYYDAKDYQTAKRYLNDYLSIQNRDFRVYNLLGAVEESLSNFQEAFNAYKRSLELCSSQKDILIKVIQMCRKCTMDPLRAKVWADKGARTCPGHPDVFELKWHLLSMETPQRYDEIENLIADELTRHPRDPSLHKKLVTNYNARGSLKEAFSHCRSVEKTGAFNDDIEWLECAVDVFDTYQQEDGDNRILAYLSLASALCKLMRVHLTKSPTRDCMNAFMRFDTTVLKLQELKTDDTFSGLMTEWKDCVNEMQGQLYLNAGIFLIKLGKENFIPWMKANQMMYACMMASWMVPAPHLTPKLFGRHSPLKRQNQQAYDWSILACSRLSQAGHMLLQLEDEYGEEWQQGTLADFCTEQGRKTILDFLYNGGDHSQSSFAANPKFLETEFALPEPQQLVQYDEVSVADKAQDLHYITWIGLNWNQLNEPMRPGVGVIVGRLFEGIALDAKNMKNCHHTAMCLRDVEAFIYGIIRSSKSIHLECIKHEDELKLLPTVICTSLVTKSQQDWWQAAYSLYTGKIGTLSPARLKVVLQKGLETLRCIKDHGIDPRILIYMAQAFWEKAEQLQRLKEKEYDYQDHWQSLQDRAVFYMKEAIRILDIFKRNKTIPICENPLIPPLSDPLLTDEVTNLLNKNYIKLGDAAMTDGKYQDALQYYEEVKTLPALYNQAQIYIKMASDTDPQTVEGEKDHLYYMTKAKEKLQICLLNAEHTPEFKQTIFEQMQELASRTPSKPAKPMPKPLAQKSLSFQANSEDTEISEPQSIKDEETVLENNDMSSMLEKSILQEQLDAKENENRSLKQALAMYEAQIEMQRQRPPLAQPFMAPPHHPAYRQQQQQFMQQYMNAQQQHAMGHQMHPQMNQMMSPHYQQQMYGSPAMMGPQQHPGPQQTPQQADPQMPPNSTQEAAPQPPPLSHPTTTQPPPPQYSATQTTATQPAAHPPMTQTQQPANAMPQHMRQSSNTMQTPPNGSVIPGVQPPQHPMQQWPRPGMYGSNPMTPTVMTGGMETPSDLWWDSFSPQPSFERGYFAGLAQHVEQVREESGEGEAPTLRDPSTGDIIVPPQDEQQQTGATPTTPKAQDGGLEAEEERVIVVTPKSPGIEPDDIYVKPIVKLESKIDEITTGEEGEAQKFVHRAKLYRFDEDLSQWKERGLGDVKLLFNDKTKKARITMRRDQVFRVCCNHMITPDMKLVKKADAQNAWSWFTPLDATEEEPRPEKFTIKFKTQEIADKFKEAFEQCQQLLSSEPSPIKPKDEKSVSQAPSFGISSSQPSSKGTVPLSHPPAQTVPPPQPSFGGSQPTFDTAPVSFGTPQNSAPTPFGNVKPQGSPGQNNTPPQPLMSLKPQGSFTPTFTTKATEEPQGSFTPTFTTKATEEPEKVEEAKPNPFANFSFNMSKPSSVTAAPQPTTTTSSPFAGFSFKAQTPPPPAVPATTVLSTPSPIAQQPITSVPNEFPMMTSLLQQQKQSPPIAPLVNKSPQQQNVSPSKTVIPGMEKLPVFEKGIVDTAVDPASFWSNATAGVTFFSGNKQGLDTIGHTADEPREVDEDEFFKTNNELGEGEYDEDEENEEDEEGDYDGNYYGENGEYYGDDMGDYDYDPNDDFGYDEDDEDDDEDTEGYEDFDQKGLYPGSRPSSGRRTPEEAELSFKSSSDAPTGNQVEDRFNIQRREPQGVIEEIIEDEISMTYERTPAFNQKMKAARFQLPTTFYLYEADDLPRLPFQRKSRPSDKTPVTPKIESKLEESTDSKPNFGINFGSGSKTGFGSGFSGSSFASLASNTESGFSGTGGAFSGAGAQLFGASQDDENAGADDYDPHYEAIVQVKKLDNIQTGEEDDEVLFKHRAKLYRFDKQWKERGVGDIKLTKNTKTGYCRVLMRRDQIHKLCANHAIMPNMELKPLNTSDVSWIWFTPSDYSEGVPPEPVQFCVKFKNKDIAEEFKKQFVASQGFMETKLAADELQAQETGSEAKEADKITQTMSKVSIEASKEKAKEQPKQQEESSAVIPKETDQVDSKPPNPFASFSFGASKSTAPAASSSPFGNFTFGGGNQTVQSALDNEGSAPSPFSSLSLGSSEANKPAVETTSDVDKQKNSEEPKSPGYFNNEEDDDIHVEAIVQVSKLDSVVTGEENETTMFENRSKLYRFDSENKQWKERGLGVLKLTRTKGQNSCRVLMRRDQVHKLCANHAVVSTMEVKPLSEKSDKQWTWFTQADFSEEEQKPEYFCAKFKTSEIAKEFKEKFDECIQIVGGKSATVSTPVQKAKPQTSPSPQIKPTTPNATKATPEVSKSPSFSFQTNGPSNAFSNMNGFSFTSPNGNQATSAPAPAFSLGHKATEEAKPTAPTSNIFSKFAAKKGAWECETCLVENKEEVPQCLSCETANPNAPKTDTKPVSTTGGFSFGAQPSSTTASSGFSFGNSGSNQQQSSGFSFGGTNTTTNQQTAGFPFGNTSTSSQPASGFSFGSKTNDSQSSGFSFGGASKADPEQSSGFSFGKVSSTTENTEQKPTFSFAKTSDNPFSQFTPGEGSWECDACLIENTKEVTECESCETPKPTTTPKETPKPKLFPTQQPPAQPTFSFAKGGDNVFGKLAPAAGSWECDTCMVSNNEEAMVCESCETPNPNAPKGATASSSSSMTSAGGTFKFPSSDSGFASAFSFGGKPADSSQSSGFKFGEKPADSAQSSGFKFGGKPADSTQSSGFKFGEKPADSAQSSGFKFGEKPADSNQSSGFKFGEKPVESNQSSDFKFGGKPADATQSSGFSFGGKPVDSSQSSGFKFGEKPGDSNQSSGFSFGGKAVESSQSSGFSFGGKPADSNQSSGFSFGGKPADSNQSSDFSFGTPTSSGEALNGTPNPGFTFGQQPTSTGFKFGQNTTDDPVQQDQVSSSTTPNKNDNFKSSLKVDVRPKTTPPAEDKFKADPDTWECVCLIKNAGHRDKCRECGHPRQKTPVVKLNPEEFSQPINFNAAAASRGTENKLFPFSVAVPSNTQSPSTFSWGQTATPKAQTTPKKDVFQAPTGFPSTFTAQTPKNDGFAVPKGLPTPTTDTKKSNSWIPTGLNTGNLFSFGANPKPSLSNASSVDDLSTQDTFSGVTSAFANAEFSFTFEPTKTAKTPSPTKSKWKVPTSPTSPEYDPEGEANVEFSPLVSLSQLKTQSTGEENESCLFANRCKLFRYDANQWKERGVGELKILLNKKTGNHRLIMRRDQIHKLCANHNIRPGTDLNPMKGSNKAYIWQSLGDISDDEPKDMMFAARFKDEEIASQFAQVFKKAADAQESVAAASESSVIVVSDGEDEDSNPALREHVDDDELTLTYEAKPTHDLREKARMLLLPISFYNQPTVQLRQRPTKTEALSSSMVDSGTMTERPRDIILTYTKEASSLDQNKAQDLLLPKSFFNRQGEKTEVNQPISLSDEESDQSSGNRRADVAPRTDELFKPIRQFDAAEFKTTLFEEKVEIFKFMTLSREWVAETANDVNALILTTNENHSILLLSREDNVCYEKKITKKMSAEFRQGEPTMVEVHIPGQFTTDKYAFKYQSMVIAENFKEVFTSNQAEEETSKISPDVPQSIFGGGLGNLSFASLASSGESGFTSNAGQQFSGAGRTLFGAGNQDEGAQGEDDHDVYVEPIVQLSTVAVTSGEEEEDCFFNQRCKLYRFADKKWRERGVGEMKILRHRGNGKARLVMRRDQVRKLCANHFLVEEMTLEPFKTNELTITWMAFQDISEEKAEDLLIAAKFKNQTILSEFKDKFDKLKRNDITGLTPVIQKAPEEGSQAKATIGACDPKLAETMKQLNF